MSRSMSKIFSKNSIIVFLFIVIGFGLYVNTFSNQMFWDDDDFILKNQYVKNWQYLPKYFSENVIAGAGLLSNYWRPVMLLIHSVQWHLWADWVLPYHFLNLIIHLANAVLLFYLLLRLFNKRWLALFTALFFLIHPVQTESVAAITALGRPAVFFLLLGALFYLKARIASQSFLKSPRYFFSLMLYALSLLTEESALMMPLFLVLIDFFYLVRREGSFSFRGALKKIAKTIWPFIIMGLLYVALRATVLNFINTFNLYDEENVFTANIHVRVFTFFRILLIYLSLLIWPFNLHMERNVAVATSLLAPDVIFGGIIFFGLLILAFVKFRKYPILSFGIFWFFIGLVPTSNIIVPINGLIYEHWLYLPLAGVFLAIIWLGIIVSQRYQIQKILSGALVLVLIFFGFLTINRNRDWRDPITFFSQTLKYAPDSYRVANNLGMAYAESGNHTKAEEAYQRAIAIDPSAPVAYHNLGNLYQAAKKDDLALENYKTAIVLDPRFIFSYNALFNFYLNRGDYKEARAIFEDYLKFNQPSVDIFSLLAQTAVDQKDFGGALDYLQEAKKIEPKNQAIQASIIKLENLRNLTDP